MLKTPTAHPSRCPGPQATEGAALPSRTPWTGLSLPGSSVSILTEIPFYHFNFLLISVCMINLFSIVFPLSYLIFIFKLFLTICFLMCMFKLFTCNTVTDIFGFVYTFVIYFLFLPFIICFSVSSLLPFFGLYGFFIISLYLLCVWLFFIVYVVLRSYA